MSNYKIFKSLILFSLFPLLLLSFINGNNKKSDWENNHLQGKVKSIGRYSYAEIGKDTSINPSSIIQNDKNFRLKINYDINGNLLGWDGRNDNHLLVCNYDDSGNMITQFKYNSEGKIIHQDTFKYDDKANLIEHTGSRLEKDTSRFKYFYKYDEKGNQIEFENNSISNHFYQKFIYKYDDKGNKIEDVEYDQNGQYNMMWIYSYDEHGNKTEGDFYADSLIYKAYYKYDEHGSMIEERRVDRDNSEWDHFHYKYEYDKEGNWIKQYSPDNKERREVTIRFIEYY